MEESHKFQLIGCKGSFLSFDVSLFHEQKGSIIGTVVRNIMISPKINSFCAWPIHTSTDSHVPVRMVIVDKSSNKRFKIRIGSGLHCIRVGWQSIFHTFHILQSWFWLGRMFRGNAVIPPCIKPIPGPPEHSILTWTTLQMNPPSKSVSGPQWFF